MEIDDGGESESDVPANANVIPTELSPSGIETSRTELLAYYAYNAGNNGVTYLTFAAAAFQNLLERASDKNGNLLFAGSLRDVEDIVLFANGLSFTMQSITLIILGGYADFGNLRSKVLLFWSVAAFITAFAWLGVTAPSSWKAGVALYSIGRLTYEMCLVYWTAAFPQLARDSPALRNAASALTRGKLSHEQYEKIDMIERSRISNIAFFIQSVAAVSTLVVIDIALRFTDPQRKPSLRSKGLSYLIVFTAIVWLILALPWFLVEKKRPGQKVPASMTTMRAGIWQIQQAASKIWLLKQSLVYLICFFVLENSINSSYTVFATMQYNLVGFDMILVSRLYAVQLAAQGAGIYTYWWLQQRFMVSTKTMLGFVILATAVMNTWGLLGNFMTSFGFHNVWEVWAWQAYFGFFVCPWYSYSQIMISSVTPRGYESMFFSFFGIASKVSLLVGHFVNSAMVHGSTGKNRDWAPFYFLFILTILSGIGFWVFLDEQASISEQQSFLAAKANVLHSENAYDQFELSNLVADSERSSFSS